MKHMTCKLKDIPNLNVSPLLWYYKNFYAHCYVIFWESNLRYNIVLHLNIWFLGNYRLFKMKCSVCWLILSINVSWVLRKQILQLTLSWYHIFVHIQIQKKTCRRYIYEANYFKEKNFKITSTDYVGFVTMYYLSFARIFCSFEKFWFSHSCITLFVLLNSFIAIYF